MSTIPTPVLVPGVLHSPIHYKALLKMLEDAGYAAIVEKNPSCDAADPFIQDVNADSIVIRNTLLS